MAGHLDRGIRVFISSTFKDMLAERDVLVSRTFPALRSKLRDRGVELCEIDLRWGITEEQSERGDTLPILFSEIDRCRPYFIGILGDRYGWIPSNEVLTRDLVRTFPWLDGVRGRSVTEMEIRYGALSAPRSNVDVLFFERVSGATIDSGEGTEAEAKLSRLKADIRESGLALQTYDAPESLARAVEAALLALVERRFPSAAQNRGDRSERLHTAFAEERRRLYVGGASYRETVRKWLQRPGPPLLFTGASGGGKSAVLANFAAAHRAASPHDLVIEHYLGAAPDAGDPLDFLRRLWSKFEQLLAAIPSPPPDSTGIIERLPEMLAAANAAMEPSGQRALIVLDGLDKLTSGSDLNWLPPFLPPSIRLLTSALPGRAYDAALARRWETRSVVPLTPPQRREVMEAILQKFGKTLADDLAEDVVAHGQSGTPLFLRTVLDELRRFGSFEELAERVRYMLAASDVGQLFDRVLQRLERNHGASTVASAARLIWAARAGLEEAEIIAALKLAPLDWSALRNGFGDTLRDQDGRMFFDHDYLRGAVSSRYLVGAAQVKETHLALADHFTHLPPGLRRSEELPFQLGKAEAWPRLTALLTDMTEFCGLRARGDAELLGHWLLLAPHGAAPDSNFLQSFFAFVGAGSWTCDHIMLADDISGFLHFAGVRGPEIVRLAQGRVAQAQALNLEAESALANAALADAMFDARDYDAARGLQEQNVAAASRLHGSQSRKALRQRIQLARMLRVRAFREAAIRYRTRTREAFGFEGGTEFGRVLSPEELENRADQVLRQALFSPNFVRLEPSDDLLDAALVEEEVLGDATSLFGDSDPITLESAMALAEIHGLVGDIENAKQVQEHVVQTRMRLLGSGHPDTLRAMETYVEILCSLRFLDNARTAEESVLERRRATLGDAHPLTLKSKQLLADIRAFVDDDAASLALKREIQTGRRVDVVVTSSAAKSSVRPAELLKGVLLIALAGGLAWASYHADTLRTEGLRLLEQVKSQLGID